MKKMRTNLNKESKPMDKDATQNRKLKFSDVAAKIQKIVAEHNLKPEIVDEAVQWARGQKKEMQSMKKIYEFPILWSGWELDDKGWVAEDNNGKLVIILTNHGSEYIASIEELKKHLQRYKEATEATEKAIKMVQQ